MGLVELFGCTLLAFGPPLAMFVITVAKDPIRVIVLITSSFFWLVSLLLSALIWFVFSPLKSHLAFALFFSVFLQELFRYLFYIVIKKAQKGLSKVQKKVSNTNDMLFDSRIISYVSGLGFGIISGVFSLVNVLNDMNGPATIGIYGDSKMFFLVTSLMTLCFIFFHVFWSVIMYLSLMTYNVRSVQLWISMVFVVGSHLIVSGVSLVNDSKNPNTYIYSVLFSYALLVVNAVFSIHIVKKSYKLSV